MFRDLRFCTVSCAVDIHFGSRPIAFSFQSRGRIYHESPPRGFLRENRVVDRREPLIIAANLGLPPPAFGFLRLGIRGRIEFCRLAGIFLAFWSRNRVSLRVVDWRAAARRFFWSYRRDGIEVFGRDGRSTALDPKRLGTVRRRSDFIRDFSNRDPHAVSSRGATVFLFFLNADVRRTVDRRAKLRTRSSRAWLVKDRAGDIGSTRRDRSTRRGLVARRIRDIDPAAKLGRGTFLSRRVPHEHGRERV